MFFGFLFFLFSFILFDFIFSLDSKCSSSPINSSHLSQLKRVVGNALSSDFFEIEVMVLANQVQEGTANPFLALIHVLRVNVLLNGVPRLQTRLFYQRLFRIQRLVFFKSTNRIEFRKFHSSITALGWGRALISEHVPNWTNNTLFLLKLCILIRVVVIYSIL